MWTADSLLHIRISVPLGSAIRAQELEQSGGSIGGVDGHQEANRKQYFHTWVRISAKRLILRSCHRKIFRPSNLEDPSYCASTITLHLESQSTYDNSVTQLDRSSDMNSCMKCQDIHCDVGFLYLSQLNIGLKPATVQYAQNRKQ